MHFHPTTAYYSMDKIHSASSVAAFDLVPTESSSAVVPPAAAPKAPAAPEIPFRTTSAFKMRYHQPRAQDSLDFDKILQDDQLPVRLPTSSKKRNLPNSERSLNDQRHRRSDDFIGHRVYRPHDEDWSEAEVALNESPFLTIRPTTEQLLEAHLREARPIPRGFQVFQNLMRWNLGRRAGGVDLSFLREQDRAFSDLRAEMSGRVPRGSNSNATAVASGAALATISDHNSNGAVPVASAAGRPGSASKTKSSTGAHVTTTATKRRSPSPCPRPTTPGLEHVRSSPSAPAAKKACTGSSTTSPGRSRAARLATSSLSPHRSDRSVESKGTGGSSSGEKPSQPKQQQQSHEKGAVARGTASSVITTNSNKRGGSASRKEVLVLIPAVVVTDNDEIRVDGVMLQPGGPKYARVFGVAYDEKARDPEWKIANGMVDRCYYRGPKKDSKARPGDYFPTDHSMLADFIRRRPDVFMEE